METGPDERSLGTLFGDLTQQVSDLVRQEVLLARAEMSEKVGQIGGGVNTLMMGTAFAYAGLTFVLLGAVIGLALLVPAWLAALFVGLVAANIGVFLLWRGKRVLQLVDLTPRKTLRSLNGHTRREVQSGRRVA